MLMSPESEAMSSSRSCKDPRAESEAMWGSWSCKDTGSELRSVHLAAKMLVRPESEATFGFWSCKYAHAARI